MQDIFNTEYKNLNSAQRQAVDGIDGPVMVVAGPGTGKTQVLSLRIANILNQTDTPANGILCLTFTRSGVSAMRKRLEKYIGNRSRDIVINTFHSFAGSIVEKYYDVLGFDSAPELIDENKFVFIYDEILSNGEWPLLKSKISNAKHFGDLKNLISLLKSNQISPTTFITLVDEEIEALKNDPENISSRGETKGEIKQAIVSKIERLEKAKQAGEFYLTYEEYKRANLFMDYDDVLAYAVKIVEDSIEAQSDIKEEYLYVLVDEHQDSSYIQNQFLKAVWQKEEKPNIFIVGDDRQLIYGFSGANINYFKEFAHIFGKAQLITLVENYRSSKNILEVADSLLSSSITTEKLNSNIKENHKLNLLEYAYPRDEIIGTAVNIKSLLDAGEDPKDIAVLVPKNKHIKEINTVFSSMGIVTNSEKTVSLFVLPETDSYIRILKIITNPFDAVSICEAILDSSISGVPVMEAHTFVKNFKGADKISIENLVNNDNSNNLFAKENKISIFGQKLASYLDMNAKESISSIVSIVGNDLFIDKSISHQDLLKNIEIVRTFIYLASSFNTNNPKAKLVDFLDYLARLEEYSANINVLLLGQNNGIDVMTMHKSKGLEYKHVYVLHLNQEVLSSSKNDMITLPEKVKALKEEKDEETLKRELYVAITRAKEHCNLSYAQKKPEGAEMSLAYIVADLPETNFEKKNYSENEEFIIQNDVKYFALRENNNTESTTIDDIKSFTKDRFTETNVSVTLLNNFFECPWKWYFKSFLKLPSEKPIFLAVGSSVHKTLEFILNQKTLPTKSVIKDVIVESLKKQGVYDEYELSKYAKDCANIVDKWIDKYYKNLANSRISERKIPCSDKRFPNLKIYGEIDLTEYFGADEVIVTDFKTGSVKTKSEINKKTEDGRMSDLLRQLAMYSYLVQSKEGKKVTASRLLFLEAGDGDKNELFVTHINEEEIDLLVKDIKDYEGNLLSGEWVNMPCNAKSYGKQDFVCEHCKRANKIILAQ